MRGWSLNDINPQNKHKKLISVFNPSTLEEQATAAMDKLVSTRLRIRGDFSKYLTIKNCDKIFLSILRK